MFVNGYPMNEDGYEPYKDVYIVDVKDPARPTIIGTLPRPVPPKEAPYTDFRFTARQVRSETFGVLLAPG